MRDLYVILSVAGWAWCLLAAVLLWVRLGRPAGSRRGATDGPAPSARSQGRPEAEA